MIIHTHSAIGNFLYSYIIENTNLSISKKHFILGNVKPDINKTLKNLPHRSKDIIEVMECLTHELINREHSINKFSEKLGILCHFLCDTFCKYHFDEILWNKNIVEHLKYEISLHYIFMANITRLKETVQTLKYENNNSFNVSYDNLTKSYILNRKSMVNDLDHALMFSVSTIEMINSEIYKENLNEDCLFYRYLSAAN